MTGIAISPMLKRAPCRKCGRKLAKVESFTVACGSVWHASSEVQRMWLVWSQRPVAWWSLAGKIWNSGVRNASQEKSQFQKPQRTSELGFKKVQTVKIYSWKICCNYPNRPDDLEDLYLHDFVANYNSHSKDSQRRKTKKKDYFYSLLLLFVPFRDKTPCFENRRPLKSLQTSPSCKCGMQCL